MLASDWADIFIRGYWLGGYFNPRFLIGRAFIRVLMPAPSHHREICSKSTREFLLWFHRLKILQFLWVNSKVLDRFNKKQTVPFY